MFVLVMVLLVRKESEDQREAVQSALTSTLAHHPGSSNLLQAWLDCRSRPPIPCTDLSREVRDSTEVQEFEKARQSALFGIHGR